MPLDREWTVDDLDNLPDNGLQYELFDGVLVVSPAPTRAHQLALKWLFLLLHDACPPELETLFAPFDFQPTDRRSAQPDILVVRSDDPDNKAQRVPPLLVVEVLSPSTKTKDLVLKKHMYETSGVPLLWVFDPGLDKTGLLSLTVHELIGGAYRQTVAVHGGDSLDVDQPFPVRISPADLIAR